MKKLLIVAAFAALALFMVSTWSARNGTVVATGLDHNVPGATTGQGRSSLLSK